MKNLFLSLTPRLQPGGEPCEKRSNCFNGLRRQSETVKTVLPVFQPSHHRAEATVLMRGQWALKKCNAFGIFLVCLMTFIAQSEVVKIELPPETAVYKSAPGADLANAQCLTCHSADYASSQPPMPAKFWKGAVDKMIAKYGAPIPTNQVDQIVDYLAVNYGTEKTNAIAATSVATAKNDNAALDAKALAIKNGCFNCHQVGMKIIGPAYKDVAAKYKADPEALMKVSHQITDGGSGKWGPIPMPPFKQLSEPEVKTLAEWVLSQK
jgi:cytochrome c551/c552